MAKVTYTGTEAHVLLADGQAALPGEPVEVTDEVAASLLERDDFAKPASKAAKAAASEAADEQEG